MPVVRFFSPLPALVVVAVGALLGGFPHPAHSQTAPPPATEGAAPPDAQTPLAPEPEAATEPQQQAATELQVAGARQLGAARALPDTARGKTRREVLEGRMREMMTRSGIPAPATQDAVLAFMRQDEDSKRTVRDAGRRLWNGVRREAPAERLRALLGDYQKALQEARDARLRAQTALDARVGYSLDARLESLLWLIGVLGEGQNTPVMPPPPAQPALPRGPRMMGGARQLFVVPAVAQRQIEGIVNAKNAPGEAVVWLEIRDQNGALWRLSPSTQPDAQLILNHQIEGLAQGERVLVRVAPSTGTDAKAPLPLLAIVPFTAANGNGADPGYGEGAGKRPDGH